MRFDLLLFQPHRLVLLAAASVVAMVGNVCANEPESDPYPLRKCVIRECELEDGANVIYVGDREIRVCCEDCVNEFSSGEDAWIAVIDERIVEQQTPFYPLKRCVVDSKPLDDFNTMDKVVGNRLFRLCSDDCCDAVEQQPAKYFGILNKEVIKQQKPKYPVAKCIVSDEPLGRESLDHVVGNQLIRLSRLEQLDKFDENPGKYLEKLRKLTEKKSK